MLSRANLHKLFRFGLRGSAMHNRITVAAAVFVVGLVAAIATPAAAQSQRFPDVAPDHYAFEAVEWAAEVEVTTGYTDGTFKPARPLSKRHAVVFMERYYDEILGADESEDFTRGDMMVLLKAINDGTLRGTDTTGDPAPDTNEAAQSQRFPDVAPDHYAFEAVEWAAEVEVTTGYTDGTFKPARPLSKRHAVVFMERYYDEILGADESEDFTRGDMMVLLKAINDGTLPEPEPTTSGTAATDRAALVALYNATDGPNWRNNTNWLSDKPIGAWYGITTNHSGRVTSVVMHYNGLTGYIPLQIGDLTALENLELNGIDGVNHELSALSDLPNLRFLSLMSIGISDLSALIDLPNVTEILDLRNNRITDISPLLSARNLQRLVLVQNPLSSSSVYTHIPVLQARGVEVQHAGYALTDGDLTIEDGPLIYNDNLVVLPVTKGSTVQAYTSAFYEHFDDEFDFLVLVSTDGGFIELGDGGYYISVANDVEGIGLPIYSNSSQYGSAGRLQGIPIFSHVWWVRGILLHEVLHRWAAYGSHPLARGDGHFSIFSNIHGAFGGAFSSSFEEIVDLGDNRYSANRRGWFYAYGPLELYLAGLIPPEDVPDFWVATNGQWIDRESGTFTATNIREYTVSDVVATYGRRVPEASSSRREFRAVTVLVIDERDPTVDSGLLESLSADMAWFSFPGTDESEANNFYEATGGRATFRTDGLAQFLKDRE